MVSLSGGLNTSRRRRRRRGRRRGRRMGRRRRRRKRRRGRRVGNFTDLSAHTQTSMYCSVWKCCG